MARKGLRDDQSCRCRRSAGNGGVCELGNAGPRGVEVGVGEADLVVFQVVDHVRGAQEGVTEEVRRAAGGVDAEVAGGGAVLQGGDAAVLGDDGDDELVDANDDGGSGGAAEGEVEGGGGGAETARDGVAVVGVVGGPDSAENSHCVLVGEIGEAGSAIEDDGDGEVCLRVLGVSGAVLHAEGG